MYVYKQQLSDGSFLIKRVIYPVVDFNSHHSTSFTDSGCSKEVVLCHSLLRGGLLSRAGWRRLLLKIPFGRTERGDASSGAVTGTPPPPCLLILVGSLRMNQEQRGVCQESYSSRSLRMDQVPSHFMTHYMLLLTHTHVESR